jgi:hypothetical protein
MLLLKLPYLLWSLLIVHSVLEFSLMFMFYNWSIHVTYYNWSMIGFFSGTILSLELIE